MCLHVFACVYVCVYMYVVCLLFVCVRMCICLCMYLCVCVRVCVHACVCAYVCDVRQFQVLPPLNIMCVVQQIEQELIAQKNIRHEKEVYT